MQGADCATPPLRHGERDAHTPPVPLQSRRLPLRPLATCLATLLAGSALAAGSAETPLGGMAEPLRLERPQWPTPLQPATPRAPQDVVVTNCFDSGAGSLRDAIETPRPATRST